MGGAVHACSALITETLIPEKADDEPDSELNDTSAFGDTVRGWVDKVLARGNKSEIEAVRAYAAAHPCFSKGGVTRACEDVMSQ